MMDQPTAMHVARIRSSHTDKRGREREYESRLLRHTYREGGKVRHKTVANLSKMPPSVVDAVEDGQVSFASEPEPSGMP